MSYTVCPNCGQNALSVATRCPRCGLAFESQFYRYTKPRPRQMSLGLLLAGLVVTVLVASALWQRFGVAPAAPPIVRRPAPMPPARVRPEPSRESLAATAGTVVTAPPAQPRVATPPVPAAPQAPAAGALVTPVVTAAPSTPLKTKTLYASTWLNLRSAGRNSAPVLRILRPGEVVHVDSLSQGWYRVVSDQQPPGWVDRRLLDTLPPPQQPAAHE